MSRDYRTLGLEEKTLRGSCREAILCLGEDGIGVFNYVQCPSTSDEVAAGSLPALNCSMASVTVP